jgi:ankyrin repeat protein
MLAYLIEKGANLLATNANGQTAFQVAQEKGWTEQAQILEAKIVSSPYRRVEPTN